MIQKLCKYGLIRAGTLDAQLQSVATCRRAEPRDLQAYANAVRAALPQVIIPVHPCSTAVFSEHHSLCEFRTSRSPFLYCVL